MDPVDEDLRHRAAAVGALHHLGPALRVGAMEPVETGGDLLIFKRLERYEEAERLLCVFNLGHDVINWSPPAGWRLVEAVNWSKADAGRLPPLAGLLFEAE
mgnify:CR=1 FL=1